MRYQDTYEPAGELIVARGDNLYRVIGRGDPLDGSTVEYTFFEGGLNNLGQLAFAAQLTDGRYGVFLATPVPEPSTLVLVAVASALICLARIRSAS
jgi:hypothetical protein